MSIPLTTFWNKYTLVFESHTDIASLPIPSQTYSKSGLKSNYPHYPLFSFNSAFRAIFLRDTFPKRGAFDRPHTNAFCITAHDFTMMEEENSKYKVILLGDTGVGKTSIARWQTSGSFDFKMSPTVGASHLKTTVQVSGRAVDLMLWDTAGQEQFSSLVPMYSRGAHAAILVASIVNPDSCEHLTTWQQRVISAAGRIPVVVAVNKSDLSEGAPVSFFDLRERCRSTFPVMFLVSAKTGDSIPELFRQVAEDVIRAESIQSGADDGVNLSADGSEGCSC